MGCSNSTPAVTDAHHPVKGAAEEVDDTPGVKMIMTPETIANQAIFDKLTKNGFKAEDIRRVLKDTTDAGLDITDKGTRGQSLLHIAAATGNSGDICEMLLKEFKADVSALDNTGNTPLHYAADSSNTEQIKTLLKWKAPVDAQNEGGQTALLKCINQDNKEKQMPADVLASVTALVRGHAKVNLKSRSGTTPLIEAINDVPSLVKYLLDHHADANLAREDGATPLMVAAATGNLEAVKMLVKDGDAKVDATDKKKRTALTYAEEGKFEEIAKYLEKTEGTCTC